MPQARRQRFQARFGDDPNEEPIRFVHYTSAEAALNIIKTKRMWMRNTTCMADYREVQHGLQIIQKFLSEKAKAAALVTRLERIISPTNGPYVALLWTNQPELRDEFEKYSYASKNLPNPILTVLLTKAECKTAKGKFRLSVVAQKLEEALAEAVGDLAARTAKPLTTSALTPEYRREMIRVFTKRAVLAAAAN